MLNTRTVILGIAALLTLLLAGGAAWFAANQDRFAQALVERLEERLVTDAHIERIELDLWSHFPEVSLVLHDVWLLGSHSQMDTLMKASELAVACNAIHLVRGQYTLQALEVRDGYMALASKAGAWNTDVWQATDDATENASFAVEQLSLLGMRIHVNGEAVGIDRADFALNWTESGLIADGNGLFAEVISEAFSTEDLLEWQGQVDWNSLDNAVRLELEEVMWAGATLEAKAEYTGDWSVDGKASGVTLQALRKALEGQDVLPGLQTAASANGQFNWDGQTFKSNWTLPMAEWEVPVEDQLLALEGEAKLWVKFEQGQWRADAPQVRLRCRGLDWSGSVERILFDSGSFEASGEGEVDWAQEPLAWMPSDWMPAGRWPSAGQMEWRGMIKRKRSGAMDWNGRWTAAACEGVFDQTPWTASGSGSLDGPALLLDTLNGRWDGIAFSASLEGQLPLSERPNALWRGTIHVPAWSLDANDSSAMALADLRLPPGIQTDFDVSIDAIQYGDWRLESAVLRLKGDAARWAMPRFSARTLDGQLSGDGTLSFTPDASSAHAVLHPTAAGCDLRQLFLAFDDFDQKTLRAEHLIGTFDASGSVQCILTQDLSWDASSLDILGSASVRDGELIQLEAFQDMANYLRSNRLMAPLVDPDDLAQRLEAVQFDYLEAPVYVTKGTVQLPCTSVSSSAMDITLEGVYQFDSSIDYTVGFALRDLRSAADSEFGTVEDDGLGHRFFVSMTGTVDEPVYGWDREAQKNHRRENYQREKDLLRELFRKSKP